MEDRPLRAAPAEPLAPRPLDRLLAPLNAFSRHKLAGAGLLMLATVSALIWANGPYAEHYEHLLHLELGLTIGDWALSKSLHHWINDGLMGIFFFLVGLEIKRELLVGELSSRRRATLPAVAALGGMVVPALVYFALNREGEAAGGWGIPMATDIAFALGLLSLLGDRVPIGLKVFLTALAIVDDIGAVLVIAIFYTSDISLVSLVVGFAVLALSAGLNWSGGRNAVAYFILGTLAWLAFLESGVHATIAALLMAFTIPARTRIDGADFMRRTELLTARLRGLGVANERETSGAEQLVFERMSEVIDHATAPLMRIEHALVGLVTFVVLPLFALANAGVSIGDNLGEALTSAPVFGITLGLFVGKTLGILGASWLAVRVGLADLPAQVRWPGIAGVAMLGGVGFTMALFVATLAFASPAAVELAKVGILAGSAVSALAGLALLRATLPAPTDARASESI
jgi:NhaA family Na+:H+ antiporter